MAKVDGEEHLQRSPRSPAPLSAPPVSATRPPDRPNMPTRSSTLGTPKDYDRSKPSRDHMGSAKSEDLNHSNSNDLPPPPHRNNSSSFLTPSRPLTPADSRSGASSDSGFPDEASSRRLSVGSNTEITSVNSKPPSSPVSTPILCTACAQPMDGAFVRALDNVWHLQCFKCQDCDAVVASKFFPIEGQDGKQLPLCERDYFRRLNLICGKCGQALRGSYITACDKKYHVEHFTCSVCPTLFGQQDSYYEHEGDVYCHFHYSTRFATKCVGCSSAILKQFVEINRNNRDECWHPECYMINKFWNVKIVSRQSMIPPLNGHEIVEPPWSEEEAKESAVTLKEKQVRMEQQVYRIWTVLSAFEESSAACISDMLRQVSNGQYLEAIRMAEKFILHVEVLFATIDDLETYFTNSNQKGMSHVREARMLCRKTVDLFTLLSHSQDSGPRRMGMTQELLALVTGLAHYLKILIRIALTGGLKLVREQGIREALTSFLDKLHLLAIEGGNPGARRVMKGGENSIAKAGYKGTQGVSYGYKSLAPEYAGESPFAGSSQNGTSSTNGRSLSNPPSDLCIKCGTTVEEDCVRLSSYQRWHSHCVTCKTCGKAAAPPKEASVKSQPADDKDKDASKALLPSMKRPPANVDIFVYDFGAPKDNAEPPVTIFCLDHAHEGCRNGFQTVSRLEQYAFLLNVALRRLSYLLKRRGLMPSSPVATNFPALGDSTNSHDMRDGDKTLLKSVHHLDRKVSATAHLPKRSTIVESPTGKTVHPSNVIPQRYPDQGSLPREKHGEITKPVPVRPPRPPVSLLSQPQVPPARPRPAPTLNTGAITAREQVIRPQFARNNTEVMIVDDSAPSSPAGVYEEPQMSVPDDGLTLADIPQLLEAQQRATPNHLRHVADLNPQESMCIKHAALLLLYRSPLRSEFDLDEILELLETKKPGFWNKLFKGNKQQKKGVFGIPLEILVEREGADCAFGASRTPLRIPSFVDDVISAMRQMDMSIEGIFRRNGNIRRLNDLTEALDRDASSVDLTQDNPVQLAALLKKFLKTLPEPLMTYKLYRLFIAAENLPNHEDRIRYLHLIMLLLPKANRDTTEVLFVFLKWVASFAHVDEETGNKMDLHNLATVISPNIFRSFSSKVNDTVRIESFEGIRVMDTLLENQDVFLSVPDELQSILRDQEFFTGALEMPSKELLKKCDTYMRSKQSGRATAAGLASPIQSNAPFSIPTGNSMGSMKPDGMMQKIDGPQMTRGRQATMSSQVPYQLNDRAPTNPIPIDGRNGHLSRQQSPNPYNGPRSPLLRGSPPTIPPEFSTPPRSATPQMLDGEWNGQQRPPMSAGLGSRPASAYDIRLNADQNGFGPNGHSPAVQLRQRT